MYFRRKNKCEDRLGQVRFEGGRTTHYMIGYSNLFRYNMNTEYLDRLWLYFRKGISQGFQFELLQYTTYS